MIVVKVDYEVHPISKRILKIFNREGMVSYRDVENYFGISKSIAERLVKVPYDEVERNSYQGYYPKTFTIDNMLKIIKKCPDVSLDYLYDLSKVSSKDLSIKDICNKTGLAESTVQCLISEKDNPIKEVFNIHKLIDNLLQSKYKNDLFFHLSNFFFFVNRNNRGYYIPSKHIDKKGKIDLSKLDNIYKDGVSILYDEDIENNYLMLINKDLQNIKKGE